MSPGLTAITGNIRGSAGSTITLELQNESGMFFGYAGSWWPIAGHKTLSSLQALFLQSANNLSDLANTSTALSNLGAMSLSGGTMSGAIAMGSHKITGIANGSASSDAAADGQGPGAHPTTADTRPAGQSAAAGSNGKWADSGHIHPPGSAFLCTPAQYAPSSQTALTTTSTVFAAVSSSSINTGNFTAPASGDVIVTVTAVVKISSAGTT